jgi:hypothetical protein
MLVDNAEISVAADGDVLVVVGEAGFSNTGTVTWDVRDDALWLFQAGAPKVCVPGVGLELGPVLAAAARVAVAQMGDAFMLTWENVARAA